nr:hypothetical protein [Bacillus alveayuensis]
MTQLIIGIKENLLQFLLLVAIKHSLSSRDRFMFTTWKNQNLSSISFSGLATNLKDGMAWGLFPLFFTTVGLSVHDIGTIVLTSIFLKRGI